MTSTDPHDHSRALTFSSPHFVNYLRSRSDSASIVFTALATCALSLLICAFFILPRVEEAIIDIFEDGERRAILAHADHFEKLIGLKLQLLRLGTGRTQVFEGQEQGGESPGGRTQGVLSHHFDRLEIYDVEEKLLHFAGEDLQDSTPSDAWLKTLIASQSLQSVDIVAAGAAQYLRMTRKLDDGRFKPVFAVGYLSLDDHFKLDDNQQLSLRKIDSALGNSSRYVSRAVYGNSSWVPYEVVIEPYDLVMEYRVNFEQLSGEIQSLLWILMILLSSGMALVFWIFVQFSRDLLIHTSRRAEDIRREHEGISGRLKTVLDTVVDGVIMTNSQGIVESYNAVAEEIFGYSADEVIGSNVSMLVGENHSKKHDAYIATYLRTGESAKNMGGTREVAARHKEGHVFTLEVGLNHHIDEKNGKKTFVATVRDLSHKKSSEIRLRNYADHLEKQKAELEQAKKAAETAVDNKNAFIATVSHEIRTPMNGLLGMMGLLANTPLSDEQKTYIEAIGDSGDTLLFLINDLLDFSKLEANKLELDKRDFLPIQLIESAVASVITQATEKGITMAAHIDPAVPQSLHGDPGRIRQILMNYLSNSVKFTDNGGSVDVHLSCVTKNAEEVRIRIEVHDTGIGIDEDGQRLIFHDFSQADASISRRYGGTGLGLSISKRIAELMDGKVGVKSEPGKGSVFWAEVVVKVGATILHSLSSAIRDLSLLRVMVIDSHPLNREVFSKQLARHRIKASDFGDMDSAMDEIRRSHVRQRPYNVILVDEEMAGDHQDIYELGCQRTDVPCFLILTSVMGQALTGEMKDKGVYLAITKPVKESTLIDIMAQISQSIRYNPGNLISGQEQPGTDQASATVLPSEDTCLDLAVLVAEDSLVSQQFAMGLLFSWGCRVEVVANGLEAVAAISETDFDLVLMDMIMPEMNGIEATEKIRQMEDARGRIPIIGVTGNILDEDQTLFLEAGVDEVIIKPIERLDLWNAIRRQLPAKEVVDKSGRIDPQSAGKRTQTVSDKQSMIKRH